MCITVVFVSFVSQYVFDVLGVCQRFKVIAYVENLEMSQNLTAAGEMSGN